MAYAQGPITKMSAIATANGDGGRATGPAEGRFELPPKDPFAEAEDDCTVSWKQSISAIGWPTTQKTTQKSTLPSRLRAISHVERSSTL